MVCVWRPAARLSSRRSSLSPVRWTGSRANARHSSLLAAENLLQAVPVQMRSRHGIAVASEQDIVQARDTAIKTFAARQKIAQGRRQKVFDILGRCAQADFL